MKGATRHFLRQAGLSNRQIKQLTPPEVHLAEVAQSAGLTPEEVRLFPEGLTVSTAGARKMAALAV